MLYGVIMSQSHFNTLISEINIVDRTVNFALRRRNNVILSTALTRYEQKLSLLLYLYASSILPNHISNLKKQIESIRRLRDEIDCV